MVEVIIAFGPFLMGWAIVIIDKLQNGFFVINQIILNLFSLQRRQWRGEKCKKMNEIMEF